MKDVSTQDILVVLVQKEKMIAALSQQVTVLMQENQELQRQAAEQTKEAL